MELQQLKYFKVVAQVGKISEAAQSLFISAPALSTSISRLEKELGVTLFDRTNNRILLNQQGQIFLRYVNQIFSNIECAKTELKQSMLQQGNHIYLACVSTTPWTDLITAFSHEHPQFTLSCTSIRCSDIIEKGLPAQHNFLLAAEAVVPEYLASELDSVILYSDTPAIAVHPDHPLASKASVTLQELSEYNLMFPMPNFSLYEQIVALYESEGMTVPDGSSHSYIAGLQMAAAQVGVTFVPGRSAQTPLLNVRFIPIQCNFAPWAFRLYWRKNHAFTKDELQFKSFAELFYNI